MPEKITPVRDAVGEIVALDIASHLFTRSPYDPRAPIPGGVDPRGWQPGVDPRGWQPAR
jgi:hypothetical protein